MSPTSIIVDVEATCCDDGSFPREEMEIIEIGAVAFQVATGEITGEYQSFIRPVRNPQLTTFCRELTGICQKDVDVADDFPAVMVPFSKWLSQFEEYDFCSWGFYDRSQFEQDCAFHSVTYPFTGPHRNLKLEFSEALGVKKRFGVGRALRKLGLEFEGTPHRGLDDARNIARIYAASFACLS